MSDLETINNWWAEKTAGTDAYLLAAGVKALWWSMRSGAVGSAVENGADIEQSINIILTNPRGTDPHRPTFATRILDYLDWPVPRAKPAIVREVLEALEKWEPRIKVDSVQVSPYTDGEASMSIRVLWSIPDSVVQQQQTEVIL